VTGAGGGDLLLWLWRCDGVRLKARREGALGRRGFEAMLAAITEAVEVDGVETPIGM
jgi:hypothetical protein